jgi:hypothetical protein
VGSAFQDRIEEAEAFSICRKRNGKDSPVSLIVYKKAFLNDEGIQFSENIYGRKRE